MKTDSLVTVKDTAKISHASKPVFTDTSEIPDPEDDIPGPCDIRLLNSYEYLMNGEGEGMGVYIFYVNEFDKESKECWWGFSEYIANYNLNRDSKYTCVEVYVLDMDKRDAEKYYFLKAETLASDAFLKKKTISYKSWCDGETENGEDDPFHLGIYKNPIPAGWAPGDE